MAGAQDLRGAAAPTAASAGKAISSCASFTRLLLKSASRTILLTMPPCAQPCLCSDAHFLASYNFFLPMPGCERLLYSQRGFKDSKMLDKPLGLILHKGPFAAWHEDQAMAMHADTFWPATAIAQSVAVKSLPCSVAGRSGGTGIISIQLDIPTQTSGHQHHRLLQGACVVCSGSLLHVRALSAGVISFCC